MKKYFTEEERKEAQREARRKHEKSEKRKLWLIQWKEKNKEKTKEYWRKWREAHKEKQKMYDDNYRNTKIGRATSLLKDYNRHDLEMGRGQGDLTREWIVENILSKPCAHCGQNDWKKIGCNRLDNSKPHTKDNVEPCCLKCNVILAADWNRIKQSKKVDQLDLETGEIVKVWNSVTEVKEGGFNAGNVSACCRGILKKSKGYGWRFHT